jgi:hypothetical protein
MSISQSSLPNHTLIYLTTTKRISSKLSSPILPPNRPHSTVSKMLLASISSNAYLSMLRECPTKGSKSNSNMITTETMAQSLSL